MATCSQCARVLSASDRFCIACGAPAGAASSGNAPTATHAPAPARSTAAFAAPPVAVASVSVGSGLASAPEIGLLPDERQLYEARFAPRLWAPHLESAVTVTDKRVIVRHPQTIFALFPFGYFVSSSPHSSIEQVDSGMRVDTRRVLVGTTLLLLAAYLAWSNWRYLEAGYYETEAVVAWIVALAALLAALGCFFTARRVGVFIHTGGSSMTALARGSQLREVQASANMVNKLLLETEQSRGR